MNEKYPLSVLHVGAGRYQPYSTEHSTFEIWKQLSTGFNRYTVVGRSTTSKRVSFSDGDVSVHLLPSRVRSEAEFILTQFQAISIAEKVKPDVIVSQCPVQGGLVASYLARRTNAKVLMEFHMAHYFEEKPIFSRNGVLETLAKRTLPNADRIRVLSEGMRIKLLEKYGKEFESRIVVIPTRVDLDCFSEVKKRWNITDRPKVVLVGTVNQRKGQVRFLKAVLPKLLDLEIWIVGDGPDMVACSNLALQHNATERVKLLGRLDHTDLAKLLPSADVMVLFSDMEGTPRVLLEGMAAGLPVITTSAGFCRDIVEHDKNGIILGEKPEEEIVERLKSVFSDDALRCTMGRLARKRVENEFAADKVFDRYRAAICETAGTTLVGAIRKQ